MSRGRLSAFFVGAATGSLFYYGVDSVMLAHVGKASKRAAEIREELIGYVAVPAKQAVDKAKRMVLAPLQDQLQSIPQVDMRSIWNKGIQEAFGAASSLVGGSSKDSNK